MGSWPCDPYQGRVKRLLEDDNFFSAFDEKLVAKGVHNDRLDVVYVRLGKSGKPTRIFREKPNVGSDKLISLISGCTLRPMVH